MNPLMMQCPDCRGKGYYEDYYCQECCPRCEGGGKIDIEADLETREALEYAS